MQNNNAFEHKIYLILYGLSWYDITLCGIIVWYSWYSGMTWYCMILFGTVFYGMMWYRMVWYFMLWYGGEGMKGYGVACPGIIKYGML